jgi:MFS family permease
MKVCLLRYLAICPELQTKVIIPTVGAFVGSVTSSFIGETLGRRKSIGVGAICMIIGAIIQATSFSRGQLIAGRIVAGFGMGFVNSTTPVIQSEYSPKAHRGKCKYDINLYTLPVWMMTNGE